MDAEQALFLIQARSDLRAYRLLSAADSCHQVHYLQMITEKLAKAFFWQAGHPLPKKHAFFVKFMRAIGSRRDIGVAVEIKPKASWASYVNGLLPVAKMIEQMAPAVAGDDLLNAEYPWPHAAPTIAPANYVFPIWSELQTPRGKKFLDLLQRLINQFEQYA